MTVSSEPSKSSALRLAVLILAAGEGSRLGGHPKALLTKDGSSLLRRFIHSIQDLSPTETVIVTGFYADEVESEIQSIQKNFQNIQNLITWVRNPKPEAGQSSSVRLGLESLKSNYDVLLIALCDQPHVGASEIESLLEQFKQRSAEQEIVLPTVNGQRGNPVLFSKEVVQKILGVPGLVCRAYMDQHPEQIKIFAIDNAAYVLDVDTQADIQKLGLDPL